jgi:hypothetical protein
LTTADVVVLLFGTERPPGPLTGLPTVLVDGPDDIEAAIGTARRLVVVGADADLASVLTRLLRVDRLDVEVGYVARHRGAAARAYRLSRGRRGARRARSGSAQRVPLIRDETGTAVAGAACWLPPDGARFLRGEAVVDDAVLFDGEVAGVRVEPTPAAPGLRAAVLSGRGRPRRWVSGRAAQLGTTGADVVRDGVPAARPVRRSTFYRHTEGWLLVR